MRRAYVRSDDMETSYAAADSIAPARIKLVENHILNIIKAFGPLTDSEIYLRLEMKVSPSGARSRRSELTERGLVRDSGARERLPSGRLSAMWEAV